MYIAASFGWSNPVMYLFATTRMRFSSLSNSSAVFVSAKPLSPASVYALPPRLFSPENAMSALYGRRFFAIISQID